MLPFEKTSHRGAEPAPPTTDPHLAQPFAGVATRDARARRCRLGRRWLILAVSASFLFSRAASWGEMEPSGNASADGGGASNPGPAAGAAARAAAPLTFEVAHYEIRGDTLLSTEVLTRILLKHTGTNVSIAGIVKAAGELQMEYRNRGYPTVNVAIPQQSITNGVVRFRVFEGYLAEILVAGNRYFSSNIPWDLSHAPSGRWLRRSRD